ncbi:hypothetical protein [Hafnia sp. CBA7124]|uniref:hypothetical protein n=1 Tax=Hafnia sp. CBA7124 TaxID=1848580 RepID=UPI000BBA730D|nr:hypothetical protein [Hafnia sp. CBA7124]
MSKGQTSRVNFSLYLSPAQSQADLRTMTVLQQLHRQLKQSGSDRNDVNMETRTFHRNVYLAGLQLHQLNPQLCHHVAESIGREHLTLPELAEELVRCELLPVEIPAASSAQNTDFSAQQLEQLRQVFEQSIPEVKTVESMHSAVSETIQAEGISAEQQAEFTHLRSELARMSKLLEQQNLQLQQLRLSQRAPAVVEPTRNGNAEEVDLADIAPPTEKMKKIRQKGIF